MPKEDHQVPLPPITTTADGKPRRIGVELEFAGLTIDAAADLLADHINGSVTRAGRYELTVNGDPAGPWQVELDFQLLKEMGRRERDQQAFSDTIEGLAEDLLGLFAEQIVPVEIVSPPLPMTRLGSINALIERLREAGARGTAHDLTYAFGMQFNPEIPDTDADTIRHYLQAYLCLEDWLRERAKIDLTRQLTFFADPYPKGYARATVDPAYSPHRDRLIDDYLDANPTRNRALDMLPLFTHVDAPRVRARVQDARIKARPTLHYRLPNSEVDRPGWDLDDAWGDWLVVERLAADPVRLTDLCRRYVAFLDVTFLDRPLGQLTGSWSEACAQWLSANALR